MIKMEDEPEIPRSRLVPAYYILQEQGGIVPVYQYGSFFDVNQPQGEPDFPPPDINAQIESFFKNYFG